MRESAARTGPHPLPQRERILDVARELFGSRGFDTVTMAEIARAAGVARATVFNHFGSKGALVEAITEGVFAYYAAMLDLALADTRSSTPALVRSLFDLMGFGIEQFHGFYRGVFRELMKLQVGLAEGGAAAKARANALAKLAQLVARGQERGDLSRDFETADLAAAFDSLANGTVEHWLYEDTSGSLRERMQRAAEIFLGPVARGDAATASGPLPDLLPAPDSVPNAPVPLGMRPAPKRRRR